MSRFGWSLEGAWGGGGRYTTVTADRPSALDEAGERLPMAKADHE
jgi:hypothetical protein